MQMKRSLFVNLSTIASPRFMRRIKMRENALISGQKHGGMTPLRLPQFLAFRYFGWVANPHS
jgi:hypothetical protein